MLDRETRREKILEARHREMKLKERTKSSQDKVSVVQVLKFLVLDSDFSIQQMTCPIIMDRKNVIFSIYLII